MISIASLWLPILISAVLVFVVSSIIHMVLGYHKHDFKHLPDEDAVRAVLRSQNLARDQYLIPCPGSMKAMREPEFLRKYEEGPVATLIVRRTGMPKLGPTLLQWFLFSIGIALAVAYVTSRTLLPDAAYMQIFRVAALVAFVAYGGGLVWAGIWKGVPWSKVAIDLFDSGIFALLTAGAFAGFWPRV